MNSTTYAPVETITASPTLKWWKSFIYDSTTYATFVIKLPIIIFFINKFAKKSPNVRNIYFYLLFIGFFFDILCWLLFIIYIFCFRSLSPRQCYVPFISADLVLWYNNAFSALWTLALAVNRLTAIVWWQKYDRIWSSHFWKVVVLLLVYPFLLNGWSFWDYKCRLNLDGCKNAMNYWLEDATIVGIANGVVAVLTIIIAVATAAYYWQQKNSTKNKTNNAAQNRSSNTEQKLIFHALISSLTYVLYSIFSTTMYFEMDPNLSLYAKISTHVLQHIYHLSAYVLLFVFSPLLRKQLASFYGISWLFDTFSGKTIKVHQITSIK